MFFFYAAKQSKLFLQIVCNTIVGARYKKVGRNTELAKLVYAVLSRLRLKLSRRYFGNENNVQKCTVLRSLLNLLSYSSKNEYFNVATVRYSRL